MCHFSFMLQCFMHQRVYYGFLVIFMTLTLPALGASKPLYEFGLIGIYAFLPDYPASEKGRYRFIPAPTFIYRGKIFKSDHGSGTRAVFFDSKILTVDLAFSASLPASSDEVSIRKDMPDLDFLSEIGPRITYTFFDNKTHKFTLRFPFRGVFSTDLKHTEEQGVHFAPYLAYKNKVPTNDKLSLFLSMTLNYSSEKLADYFYQVDEKYETSERKKYNAKPGLISINYFSGISYKLKKALLFGGIEYSNYKNSANSKSPLYKSEDSVAVLAGISYFFAESKERVSTK